MAAQRHDEAIKLIGELENLDERVQDTKKRAETMKGSVEKNTNLTTEAKKNIASAHKNVDKADKLIITLNDTLHKINKDLTDFTEIDDIGLHEIELKLNQTEKEFLDANLDEKIANINKARQEKSQAIALFEEEIKRLTDEVGKVKRIYLALPNECFERSNIEV